MNDPLIHELDRRLELLQSREHQGNGIDGVAMLQIIVCCWVLPALVLVWGAL